MKTYRKGNSPVGESADCANSLRPGIASEESSLGFRRASAGGKTSCGSAESVRDRLLDKRSAGTQTPGDLRPDDGVQTGTRIHLCYFCLGAEEKTPKPKKKFSQKSPPIGPSEG